MSRDALLEIFDDIDAFFDEWLNPEFQLSKKGELFERFVEKLFKRLPGWTVMRRGDTNRPDQGTDIIAVSPHGIRYVVQLKHYTSSKPSGPDVSHTYAAMALHGGHHCILCTSFKPESGGSPFTKDAQDRAKQLGVKLWGRGELALLYRAVDQPYLMRELELDHRPQPVMPPPQPQPVKTEPITAPEPTSQVAVLKRRFPVGKWLALGIITLALVIAILGLVNRQKPIPPLTASQLEQWTNSHDQMLAEAYRLNRKDRLPEFLAGKVLEERAKNINDRIARGCYLETTILSGAKVISLERISDDHYLAKLNKNWIQREICSNPAQAKSINLARGPFSIEYEMRYLDGAWKLIATK